MGRSYKPWQPPLGAGSGPLCGGKAALRELLAGWGRALRPGCLARRRAEGRSHPCRFPPACSPSGASPWHLGSRGKPASTEKGKTRKEERPETGGLGFCPRRSSPASTLPLQSLRNGWTLGGTRTSATQSCFWEAVFLPQPDLSCLSRHQLAPSGHKHPVAVAREKGKGARRHGRDRLSPARGSVGPGEGGEPDPALEHPPPPHPAPWPHRRPDPRGTGPGKRGRK